MKRLVLLLMSGLTFLSLTPLLGTAVAVTWLLGDEPSTTTGGTSQTSLAQIPASMLSLYIHAAAACAGLSWSVLAAIGTIESNNDQSTLPGVHSGQNPAGAQGPMQFEPSTFRRYDEPVPPGGVVPPTPYDPMDAVYAAARMLCADGAGEESSLPTAIYDYNHSSSYVDEVVQLAGTLIANASAMSADLAGVGPVGVAEAASEAVSFALSQVGTPYRWGGETPGVDFDCSGLVQAAWAAAGVHLPRVAQDQFDAGPLLAPAATLEPGDLVFFGPPGGSVTHVGLVVNPSGQMVDAPHTGAFVRVEDFPTSAGASWGGDVYVGATRPGAGAS